MKQSIGRDSVETFNRDMSEKNLGGHWQLGLESYLPYPETTVRPCLWKWKDVYVKNLFVNFLFGATSVPIKNDRKLKRAEDASNFEPIRQLQDFPILSTMIVPPSEHL